ncbi:hypothetical protein ACFZBP_33675 [Streptomyces sp. NPDC008086]|uniref:hypothetical protein n=1 Tax=Streptomyces sp. NPDC008086 TaxID=3364807 RepID=UPI0036E5384C
MGAVTYHGPESHQFTFRKVYIAFRGRVIGTIRIMAFPVATAVQHPYENPTLAVSTQILDSEDVAC